MVLSPQRETNWLPHRSAAKTISFQKGHTINKGLYTFYFFIHNKVVIQNEFLDRHFWELKLEPFSCKHKVLPAGCEVLMRDTNTT